MKKKILKCFQCISFIIISGFIITNLNKLMQIPNNGIESIIQYKEQENEINLTFVGSTMISNGWQPLKAWKDNGLASYVIGIDSFKTDSLYGLTKYAIEKKNPIALFIDITPLVYTQSPNQNSNIQNDLNDIANQNKKSQISNMITDYYKHNSLLAEYTQMNLFKNHKNTQNFQDRDAWINIFDNPENDFKGYKISSISNPLIKDSYDSKEQLEIEESAERELRKIMKLLVQNDKLACFIVMPHIRDNEANEKFNYIGNIVTKNGFQYLNLTNEIYETGIDYTYDFEDKYHLNKTGAEKTTKYLEKYIDANYDLPDNRNLREYNGWNKIYREFNKQLENE